MLFPSQKSLNAPKNQRKPPKSKKNLPKEIQKNKKPEKILT